jgi:organic radical activating enzyme
MSSEKTVQFYRSVKESLDAVGSGMCLAKWYQTTLHLENGHNHSCHHPKTHKTPLEELANPAALHNTEHKKRVRKQMLDGERPDECRYCWNIEDTVQTKESDRVLKSSWEVFHDNNIVANTVATGTTDVYPTSLEVSFSYTCNFKCSYCSADVSSRWMKELLKHGPFPTEYPLITLEQIARDNKMPIRDEDPNPYREAFWQWWPELYPHLKVFRITGGEPLLHKDTFRVLDEIIANPNPNLELAINSNLGVPATLWKRFVEKIKTIVQSGAIKSFTLYTSCEAHGAQAEYIRHGLDYAQWYKNCDQFLAEVPTAKISLMSTYNAMSATSFMLFLKDIVALKRKHNNRVSIDTVYMANPQCLGIDILTDDFLRLIHTQMRYIQVLEQQKLFTDWESHKITRLHEYFVSRLENPKQDLAMFRRDFAVFVDEHDRRRGTNFLKTFPQMKEFYQLCKTS